MVQEFFQEDRRCVVPEGGQAKNVSKERSNVGAFELLELTDKKQ